MESRAVRAISFIVALAAMGGAHACGTQVTGGDSESHFLASCGSRCGGGLACICGVCTRACDDTHACGALSRRAGCAAPGDSSCGVRICDVECLEDDACKSVGTGRVCIQGRCRDTAVPVEAGAGGASGSTDRFGSGTAGGALGATPPGAGGAARIERPDAGPCDSGSKTYPPPPLVRGAAGSIEIVGVQSDIDLGDLPPNTGQAQIRFRSIGFDLDGACATQCALGLGIGEVVDGPGAVDNAYGELQQLTRNLLTDFGSEMHTAQLRKGGRNLLIRVVDYDGQADDDQVRVELMFSARYNAFQSDAVPRFDGTDIFPVAGDSVFDNDLGKPRSVDTHAYVTGGKLVAAFGEMIFPYLVGFTDTFTALLDVSLHASFLTCDVSSTDTGRWGFTLGNCTVAGGVIADDLVHQLWHLPGPLDLKDPKPLCTNSTSYLAFKNTICNLRDIESSRVAGPVGPCDALSFGVNFNTVPASVGDVFNDNLFSPRCSADVDPSNDSCDAQ